MKPGRRSLEVVVSCEHAGNRVPPRWRSLFASPGALRALASHRGYDPGALAAARTIARSLRAPLVATEVTRLLVDANRSAGHPRLWSEWTRRLPPAERRRIVRDCWRSHREAVARAVARAARAGPVLHLCVHSFAPALRGRPRRIDVGLLYDPSRAPERDLCARWQAALARAAPGLRVRRNHPYRGVADGLTTVLRRGHPPGRYLGVELEINQRFPRAGGAAWRRVRRAVLASLRAALEPR